MEKRVLAIAVIFIGILLILGYSGVFEKITGGATYDLIGLVAHYKFDGNANDTLGRNPGKNHWVKFVDGKFIQAGEFDWGRYIEIPNSKDFDKWKGFTYAAWVKPRPYERDFQVIMGHDNPYFGIKDTGRIFVYTTGAGSIHGKTRLEAGEWYHVLVTWAKGDYLKVYLNGKFDGIGPKKADRVRDINPPFYIGKRKDVDASPFVGLMDEVKIWNRGLSDEEVKKEYESYLS